MKNLENVKKMMLQCVVINWDGTLVSSAAMIHQAYLKTMQALQIHPEWSPEDTMRQNGRPPVEISMTPASGAARPSVPSPKTFSTAAWKTSAKPNRNFYASRTELLTCSTGLQTTRPSRALSSAATKPNPFWSWKSRHSNLKVW